MAEQQRRIGGVRTECGFSGGRSQHCPFDVFCFFGFFAVEAGGIS